MLDVAFFIVRPSIGCRAEQSLKTGNRIVVYEVTSTFHSRAVHPGDSLPHPLKIATWIAPQLAEYLSFSGLGLSKLNPMLVRFRLDGI